MYHLSREARLVSGITLLTAPTIMVGGAVLLGVLTKGAAGYQPAGLELDETQWALYRAGHAHAGVWLLFSLVVQVLLDSATLSSGLKWLARIAAPLGPTGPARHDRPRPGWQQVEGLSAAGGLTRALVGEPDRTRVAQISAAILAALWLECRYGEAIAVVKFVQGFPHREVRRSPPCR